MTNDPQDFPGIIQDSSPECIASNHFAANIIYLSHI